MNCILSVRCSGLRAARTKMGLFFRACIGLIAVVAIAGRVAAQQTSQASTQTAANTSWGGPQVGGFGGGTSMPQTFTEPGAYFCPSIGYGLPCVETPFAFSGHPVSFTGGGFLGYRLQNGNFVLGIEGDVAWKRGQNALVQTGVNPNTTTTPETFTGSIGQGWDGSVRGRFGALLTSQTLVYGTAGVAFENVSGSFSYATSAPSNPDVTHILTSAYGAGSWSDVRVGYTVGGGVETVIFGPWKARIEYRFADFGRPSEDIPLTVAGPCVGIIGAVCSGDAHINMTAVFHTLRFGLGYDF